MEKLQLLRALASRRHVRNQLAGGTPALLQKRQGRQDHVVKAAGPLAAAHDQNDGLIWIQAEGDATALCCSSRRESALTFCAERMSRLTSAATKLRAHRCAGGCDLA